jgi:hypothetical protein
MQQRDSRTQIYSHRLYKNIGSMLEIVEVERTFSNLSSCSKSLSGLSTILYIIIYQYLEIYQFLKGLQCSL